MERVRGFRHPLKNAPFVTPISDVSGHHGVIRPGNLSLTHDDRNESLGHFSTKLYNDVVATLGIECGRSRGNERWVELGPRTVRAVRASTRRIVSAGMLWVTGGRRDVGVRGGGLWAFAAESTTESVKDSLSTPSASMGVACGHRHPDNEPGPSRTADRASEASFRQAGQRKASGPERPLIACRLRTPGRREVRSLKVAHGPAFPAFDKKSRRADPVERRTFSTAGGRADRVGSLSRSSSGPGRRKPAVRPFMTA